MQYHTLRICGLTRKLPIIQIGRHTKIASLSILGDVELTDAMAEEMVNKIGNWKSKIDYLVGPEVKAVPLVHGVAKRLGHKQFVICRKSIKPHMTSPVIVKPQSHFPKHAKPLVLNGPDAKILNGKKVFIVDDVVSTGVTMRMVDHLMHKVGCLVIGHITAIKQGQQFDNIKNLIYLAELPIFKTAP